MAKTIKKKDSVNVELGVMILNGTLKEPDFCSVWG